MTTANSMDFAMNMFRFYSSLSAEDKTAWQTMSDDERNMLFETMTACKRPAVPASISTEIPSKEIPQAPIFDNANVSDDLSASSEPEPVQATSNVVVNSDTNTQKENNMNQTSILSAELMEKAALIAKDLLKAYKQFARTADGGCVAWNMGRDFGPGGSTVAYVSPFALAKLLNGEKLQKVEYASNENNAARYEVASARKVALDTIVGTFRIFEPNLHVYPHTEGKYQERAGYVRVIRGEIQPIDNKDIIIEKPVASRVESQPGGDRLVTYKESDWTGRTGWVVLHSSRMDENHFTCGRMIEEKSNQEAIYIVKNADGSPKSFTDSFGRERFETKKSKYGADLDAIRRHEIARLVAMGYVIVITDWFNKTIKAGHCEEVGKGEQTVFLNKILMDRTFLRIRKNEIGQAWNEIKSTAHLLYGGNSRIETTAMPDQVVDTTTGEVKPVYIKNVFNKEMTPLNITRSELMKAGKFIRLTNGRPALGGAIFNSTPDSVDAVIRMVTDSRNTGIMLLA